MANPKRKISRAKRDSRRAPWKGGLQASSLIVCDRCGERMLPHHACPSCGYYRGKNVIAAKTE